MRSILCLIFPTVGAEVGRAALSLQSLGAMQLNRIQSEVLLAGAWFRCATECVLNGLRSVAAFASQHVGIAQAQVGRIAFEWRDAFHAHVAFVKARI